MPATPRNEHEVSRAAFQMTVCVTPPPPPCQVRYSGEGLRTSSDRPDGPPERGLTRVLRQKHGGPLVAERRFDSPMADCRSKRSPIAVQRSPIRSLYNSSVMLKSRSA